MGRPLAPCGSEAAYRRHLRWGQEPCDACRAEHARIQSEQRAGEPRELRPCGTQAAYRRHLNHGEVPCRACTDAHAAVVIAWWRGRKEAA